MPPKKKKPLKKQPIQKQKQKQSQRVVVNVNQQQRRAPAKRVSQPPRQQVSYQPIISMSGSVPVPQPYYNPSPIQSSSGFAPTAPTQSLGTPTSISAPVELPVFSNELVRVIGNGNVSLPATLPPAVSVPTPISRREEPPIIRPIQPAIPVENRIIIPAPRNRPPPESIISAPQNSLMTDKTLLRPPPPSVSSILSDISKETGINSKSVADFLFKKKKEPLPRPPPPSVSSNMSKDSISYKGGPPSVSSNMSKDSISYKGGPPSVSSNMSKDSISYKGGPPSVSSVITTDDNRSRSSTLNYSDIYPAQSSISSFNKAPPSIALSAPEYYVGDNSYIGPISISSNSGFNAVPVEKSLITKKSSIIVEPKSSIVSSKQIETESKFDPYSMFSSAENEHDMSYRKKEDAKSESEASLVVIPKPKNVLKEPSIPEENPLNKIAGRKMIDEPARRKPRAVKGIYDSLKAPELKKIAENREVPITKIGKQGKEVRRTKAEIQAELYKMDS